MPKKPTPVALAIEAPLAAARVTWKEFQHEVATSSSPLHVLEWSRSAFRAAAEIRVFTAFLDRLKDTTLAHLTIQDHRDVAANEVFRRTRAVTSSGDSVTQATTLAELQAWSELYAILANQ